MFYAGVCLKDIQSTLIVDRGFTFWTASFRHEKVVNFGRSAVVRNASSPAIVIRTRSYFNTYFSPFSFNVYLNGPHG